MKRILRCILTLSCLCTFCISANAASVDIFDESSKKVKITGLTDRAKIIAVDFTSNTDLDLTTDGIQNFEGLANDTLKAEEITKHTKYLRQVTTQEHIFSLPSYNVYTIFVKDGSKSIESFEIQLADPDFVDNHKTASSAELLNKNLVEAKPYMCDELNTFYELSDPSKLKVSEKLFAKRANDTAKDLIVKRVQFLTELQMIADKPESDKISAFESCTSIDYSSLTDSADYISADEVSKKKIIDRFVNFIGLDETTMKDTAFSQSLFLQNVENAVLPQSIPQLVDAAKTKFSVSTPYYNSLGTNTLVVDNAVKGVNYGSVSDFINDIEAKAFAAANSGNIGGGLGGGLGGGGGAGGGGGNKINNSNDNPVTVVVDNTANQNGETAEDEILYDDVQPDRWSYDSIFVLSKRGVLTGDGNKKFRPTDNVTRAEFVKIIISAFDLKDSTAECTFDDVAADSWSYPYIASAAKYGVVNGKSENEFAPNELLKREEAAVIIYNVAKLKNIPLEMSREDVDFTDEDSISEWADEEVKYLYRCNIINGRGDNFFEPQETLTREEAAKLVYSLMKLIF